MIECPDCNKIVEPIDGACPECGNPDLEAKTYLCKDCETKVLPINNECPECGNPNVANFLVRNQYTLIHYRNTAIKLLPKFLIALAIICKGSYDYRLLGSYALFRSQEMLEEIITSFKET